VISTPAHTINISIKSAWRANMGRDMDKSSHHDDTAKPDRDAPVSRRADHGKDAHG
jgi:hypothetical protein